MTAASFTNHASGTRRFLPAKRRTWPLVRPIADIVGETVVGVALGCLFVLLVLEWLR